MLKRKIIPLLLLVFVLAACSGGVDTETEPTAPVDPVLPTPVTAQPTPSPIVTNGGVMASCTVVSEPDSSEVEEFFPPVSEEDWVKGPATAKVTIIEYSDFQ